MKNDDLTGNIPYDKLPPVTPKELWRRIPGYDDPYYEVSNLGRVRSFGGNRMLRYIAQSGLINLYRRAKLIRQVVPTYQLVMEAFVGPKPHRHVINHKDRDRSNNRLENLEYITKSEDAKHWRRTDLSSDPGGKIMQVKIVKISCVKCGYEWSPRIVEPRRCPYCKNIDWNKPYKRKNSRRPRD